MQNLNLSTATGPTSALDQLAAEDILKLLQQLQDDLDLSYLVIIHDMGIIRRIAHYTVELLGGYVVANATTYDIFKPPFQTYTEKLLQSLPESRETWLEEIIDKHSTKWAKHKTAKLQSILTCYYHDRCQRRQSIDMK